MTRSGESYIAIRQHFSFTADVAIKLAAMFQVLLPNTYVEYERAFQAGRWVETDPGPWLGRAIVYKLQVSLHHDRNDDGPSACFPCGIYLGGAMQIPQLQAKFS